MLPSVQPQDGIQDLLETLLKDWNLIYEHSPHPQAAPGAPPAPQWDFCLVNQGVHVPASHLRPAMQCSNCQEVSRLIFTAVTGYDVTKGIRTLDHRAFS